MSGLMQSRVQGSIHSHADKIPALVSCLILDRKRPCADIQQPLDGRQCKGCGEDCFRQKILIGFKHT